MPGLTFDTHKSVKSLKAAGFQELQAEALVGEIQKLQDSAIANLATKADIAVLKGDIAAVKSDIRELELKVDAKMSDLKADPIKWVLAISAAQAALIVTLLKLIK